MFDVWFALRGCARGKHGRGSCARQHGEVVGTTAEAVRAGPASVADEATVWDGPAAGGAGMTVLGA